METKFESRNLIALRAYPAKIEAAFRAFHASVLSITSKPRLASHMTTDGIARAKQAMQAELTEAKAGALAELEAWQRDVNDRQDTLLRIELRSVIEGRTEARDANEALLGEMREAKAWRRAQAILDRTAEPALPHKLQELAKAALLANDDDGLRVLRDEAESYFTSRGVPELVRGVIEMLDAAVGEARPRVAAALAARAEAEIGIHNIKYSLSAAKHAIEQGELIAILAGWERDSAKVVEIPPVSVQQGARA